MRILRLLLPSLALAALTATGCILTSAQVLVSYDLTNPLTIASPDDVVGVSVDLNTVPDYKDNRDKIKDLSDLALLGEFNNTGTGAVDIEVWMTPTATSYTHASDVKANGSLLWGPLQVAPGATRKLTWDGAVKLFSKTGKAALIHEVMGDGVFTLYAVGAAGTYSFAVEHGVLVLVIDAAK
jgi:hypothetical protein